MIPSTSFYNSVAADYNGHQTNSDRRVRNRVMQMFITRIHHGAILDFGGGTGLDLSWLLREKYKVYFLEPSSNMRSLAKIAVTDSLQQPVFIKKNIDFHNWSSDSLPFEEKMNGILANFAVLNCLKDIGCLFEKLALVCDENCFVIATVLDTRPVKMIRNHSLKVAIKSLLNVLLITMTNYQGTSQNTYLHTIHDYKYACKKYFNFISCSSIPSSPFALLILSKK